ncbi:hypothetical protein BdWA1_003279 [Babesia duncani]|uniref:Uncharacterized protein n=1 Tax=Babesia duncani TaxID=323732 RepID=A0AAD9PJF9_9APIC|nr:hypothetical protein BdWA1_003279 [Babesia duncani]
MGVEVELVRTESSECDESNSVLYKVMVNRKIVEKVQMNLTSPQAAQEQFGQQQQQQQQQVSRLGQQLRNMEIKYNETFDALNEVRNNALEAGERALEREFRVALLEKALHNSELKLQQAKELQAQTVNQAKEERTQARRENAILESQIEQLRLLCRERDAKIVGLVRDLAKSTFDFKSLAKKQRELLDQLTESQGRLDAMVLETNQRESSLIELEASLKRRDGERQAAHLQELAKNTRTQIALQAKDTKSRAVLAAKDARINELVSRLLLLESRLSQLTNTFRMVSETTVQRPIVKVPGPDIEYVINTPIKCLKH